MTAFNSNNAPSALGGAVDLSALGGTAARPGEQVPNEFRVAVAGDANGRPHVLLAFGHLQWLFEPHLATDLGSVLLDAAQKAEAVARGERPLQEVETP
jgi:hypothetical protein